MRFAFDGLIDSMWSAHCGETMLSGMGCPYAFQAWIGEDGDYDGLDAMPNVTEVDGVPRRVSFYFFRTLS